MNSGRRMEPHIFTIHREPKWKTQCRMAHSLLWHPSHRDSWLAVTHVTPHTTAFHRTPNCIMAYASPSCSLRNLGGKTENVFLRAVLQPGQIQPTPFFLIFTPSHVCHPVLCRPTCVQSFHSQPSVTSLWGHKRRAGVPLHGVSVL